MATKPVTARKHTLRLLKLLAGRKGKTYMRETRGETFALLLESRRIVFPLSVISGCEKAALVHLPVGQITLMSAGEAHLKRALHPAEPFQTTDRQITSKSATVNGLRQTVSHNASESPLFRLFTRRQKAGTPWLDEPQFRAGERLRSDFEKANLQPRISANWEASVASGGRGSSGCEISDFAIDARERVERAIAAMGPELADIALDICCFLKGLEALERERGWPPRSAKLLLRTALTALVRHYGLEPGSYKPRAEGHLRAWGTHDYRPSLERKHQSASGLK